MNEKTCPCCGSTNLDEINETITKKVSNNTIIEFNGINDICLDCKEEGDFGGVNDKLFLLARETEEKRSLANMLAAVKKQGNSFAYIERVLTLPQRTLTRWKNQGASASGITLMKFVETYPWLLKVADHKFDPSYAKKELIQQAAVNFSSFLNEMGGSASGTLIETSQHIDCQINVAIPTPEGDAANIISPAEIHTNTTKQYGT